MSMSTTLKSNPKTSGATAWDSGLQGNTFAIAAWSLRCKHSGIGCRLYAQPATRLLMIFFLLNVESMLGNLYVMTQLFPISFHYHLSCPAQILRVELSSLVLATRKNDGGWTGQANVFLPWHLPNGWYGDDANNSANFGRANHGAMVGRFLRSRSKEATQQWFFYPYTITRCDRYCRPESQETLIYN